MTIRSAVLTAGLLAGAALQVHAQAVTLRFAPPVGQVTRYRMLTRTWSSADTSAAPAAEVAMYQTQTVVSMDSGAYTVRTVNDSMVTSGGRGRGADPMRGMAVTVRMDPRGHVLSTQVTPPPGMPGFLGNMLSRNAGAGESPRTRVWPEGPINPGDTWTDTTVEAVGAGGGHGRPQQVSFVMTYKYERLDHQGADRVVVISMQGVPQGGGGGTMSGEMAADIDAGRLVRMATDVAQGQGLTRMTMELLP